MTVSLDGGDLEVDVGDELNLKLSGLAAPVYRGALSDDFLEALREAE